MRQNLCPLEELGVEYKHVADRCGIVNYVVMTGLNDSLLFIDALCDVVNEEVAAES
jgi:protoheme ferro-lyase